MADELTGIFDALSPGDFIRETSTVEEFELTVRDMSRSFSDWVEDALRLARLSYLSSDAELNPLALLEDRTRQRAFVPDDDESLENYTHRLHAEAVLLGARRFFLVKQTLVGHTANDGTDQPIGDIDPATKTELPAGLFFYAMEHTSRLVVRSCGIIYTESNTLGKTVNAPNTQTVPLLDAVLHGVKPQLLPPAR